MKIYPWLDSTAAPVVGITYALGEHCKVLNKLEDAGWVIDGTESVEMLEERLDTTMWRIPRQPPSRERCHLSAQPTDVRHRREGTYRPDSRAHAARCF